MSNTHSREVNRVNTPAQIPARIRNLGTCWPALSQESRDLCCRATTPGLSQVTLTLQPATHLLLAFCRFYSVLGWLSTVAATISPDLGKCVDVLSSDLISCSREPKFQSETRMQCQKIAAGSRLTGHPVILSLSAEQLTGKLRREVNVKCLLHRDVPFKAFKSLQRRIESICFCQWFGWKGRQSDCPW